MGVITIDSRAGSGDMLPLFPKDMEVGLGSLEYGDFFFLGNGPNSSLVSIGVERKAIKDLLNSMATGRLVGHQLPGMVQQYEYVYLLVEGVWRYNPDSGILEVLSGAYWADAALGQRRFMAKEVVGFLNTLAIKAGVHIVYSDNRRESVQVISSLYHWWNGKNWEQHISHLSPNKTHRAADGGVSLVKPSLVRRVAAELPHIGWGKSRAVANFFPSVLRMAAATKRDWEKIPGIGGTIAKAVVDEIRKENIIIKEED